MELIIVVVVVIGIGLLLSKDKGDKSSTEGKGSSHRGGDDNIKTKQK